MDAGAASSVLPGKNYIGRGRAVRWEGRRESTSDAVAEREFHRERFAGKDGQSRLLTPPG